MSRKTAFQAISIALIVAGVLCLLFIVNWHDATSLIGLGSLILGSLGSIYSIFIPKSCALDFKKEDWLTRNEGEKYLLFTARKHGQGRTPTVQVFQVENGVFQEVMLDYHHDKEGNVTIAINSNEFDGRISIS